MTFLFYLSLILFIIYLLYNCHPYIKLFYWKLYTQANISFQIVCNVLICLLLKIGQSHFQIKQLSAGILQNQLIIGLKILYLYRPTALLFYLQIVILVHDFSQKISTEQNIHWVFSKLLSCLILNKFFLFVIEIISLFNGY